MDCLIYVNCLRNTLFYYYNSVNWFDMLVVQAASLLHVNQEWKYKVKIKVEAYVCVVCEVCEVCVVWQQRMRKSVQGVVCWWQSGWEHGHFTTRYFDSYFIFNNYQDYNDSNCPSHSVFSGFLSHSNGFLLDSQMQSNAVSVEMFLSFLPFDSCSPANQVFHHLTRRVIPAEETWIDNVLWIEWSCLRLPWDPEFSSHFMVRIHGMSQGTCGYCPWSLPLSSLHFSIKSS